MNAQSNDLPVTTISFPGPVLGEEIVRALRELASLIETNPEAVKAGEPLTFDLKLELLLPEGAEFDGPPEYMSIGRLDVVFPDGLWKPE